MVSRSTDHAKQFGIYFVLYALCCIGKKCDWKKMFSWPNSHKEWGDLGHFRGDLGHAWETWVSYSMSVQTRQNSHNARKKQEQFNYEHFNHYCHGESKLSLHGPTLPHSGPALPLWESWAMTHSPWTWPNSPIYDCTNSPYRLSALFVKIKITEWVLAIFIPYIALMTEEYHMYITHHKRAFYYVLLIC